jgi:hypothetical protein
MAVPTTIADLNTTASSNDPAGANAPSVLDDHLRALAAIIKQNVSKGSDIASSSTITIPNSGGYFAVTGTTSITGINDCWNGRAVLLKFSGALTLTNSASLILFGSNITTAAGDTLFIVNESAGVWRSISYSSGSSGMVTLSGTQTLTNKTLVAASNTITTAASGNLTSTELNAALAELQADIDTRSTTSHNHSGVYEPVLTAASQAEMEAGIETAIRSMSPIRVKQAIDALTNAGTVVQIVEATPVTAGGSTTATIPFDSTIPQITEGAEIITVTITPTSATNRLIIEADVGILCASSSSTVGLALFQDSTANALASSAVAFTTAGFSSNGRVVHEMAAGTTSATTFRLRYGGNGGTIYINQNSGATTYGGVQATRIRVTEVEV